MKHVRPWGISLMAILWVVVGALCILAGLATLGGGAVLGGLGGRLLGLTGMYVALAMFALGALTLYIAWAVWHLKSWAWVVLTVSSAISFIVSLTGLISGWSATDFVGPVVNLVVIYYLFRPEVKAAFRRTQISAPQPEETR